MEYGRIVQMVPNQKREELSNRLIDILLESKKADELPSSLAKTLLHQWRQGPLTEEETLAVLLEAALLLEKDETMRFVKEELQLIQVAEALKE